MACKVLRPAEDHPRHTELYGAVVLQARTKGYPMPPKHIRVRVEKTDGTRLWLPPMPLSDYESLNPRFDVSPCV